MSNKVTAVSLTTTTNHFCKSVQSVCFSKIDFSDSSFLTGLGRKDKKKRYWVH
jgi:hypothetical protein